jgi:hypothetical protein
MPRQFQLRTLLILIALCAIGTWWVNWPRQTAQWFVTEGYKAIPPGNEEQDEEDDESWDRSSFRRMIERDPSEVEVSPKERAWSDLLFGRQSFSVAGDSGPYLVCIVRGRVESVTRVRRWGPGF